MTKSELHKILMTVWIQWPHVPVTSEMTNLWFAAFGSYPLDMFQRALIATTLNSTKGFPPTLGEVNNMLLSAKNKPEDNITEGEVWRVILDAIKRFGSYRQSEAIEYLTSLDPRIGQCATIMGWKEMCSWQTDDEVANRAHLWKVFNGIKTRDARSDLLGLDRLKLINGELTNSKEPILLD